MAPSLRHSPTVETLVAFLAVFLVQTVLSVVGAGVGLFALAVPIESRPWTLVTSIYAHETIPHLLSNAVVLAIVGPVVERGTTRARFHAFFVTTGVLAGVAQVWVSALLGTRAFVLGGSGAVFALVGYLLAGNRLTGGVLDRLSPSPRVQFAAFVVLAAAVTVATGSPGIALAAHFTGLLLGLVAGRLRLLAG